MNNTTEVRTSYTPDTNQLRLQGWAVMTSSGPYCTVWKGSQEVILVWRDGVWQTMAGQRAVSL